MADKSNDPVAMWQNMLGEMEKGFNSFANQAMTSPEFSKVVNQVGGVTAGAQKQLGELMEKYLVGIAPPRTRHRRGRRPAFVSRGSASTRTAPGSRARPNAGGRCRVGEGNRK